MNHTCRCSRAPRRQLFSRALVARQPICERDQKLLATNSSSFASRRKPGCHHDPDHATAQVIVSSFFESGWNDVGSSIAFRQCDTGFLFSETFAASCPRIVWFLRFSEETMPDSELLERLALSAPRVPICAGTISYQEHLQFPAPVLFLS